MVELFQTRPQNTTHHLREIYAGGEFDEAATCKAFSRAPTEGLRQVVRMFGLCQNRPLIVSCAPDGK